MARKEIRVPNYTLGEELVNSISHGVGAALGIAALVLTIVASARNNTIGLVSSCVYGATMILMFLMSCIYHALSPKLKGKKVFRVIDHCDIFVFIAGTYTPYCLSLIGGTKGWILFAVVWGCAVVGATFNAIDLERFSRPSTVMYLLMGWMILFSYRDLKAALDPVGLWLLVGGGIAYSVGALLYAIGSKRKYFHSVFHFFVLAGSILQFFSIYLYVL